MQVDLNSYVKVKEDNQDNTITIVYKKKVVRCFACLKQVSYKAISKVRYPLLVKGMGRVIMTKDCCDDCIDDVMTIKNNLKYS